MIHHGPHRPEQGLPVTQPSLDGAGLGFPLGRGAELRLLTERDEHCHLAPAAPGAIPF